MIVKLWRWLKRKFKKASQTANNEHSLDERRQLQILYLFKPEPPLELHKALLKSDVRSFNHKKKRRKKK